MSVLSTICNICYSNETHHKLKCNTCKHNVCNDCFSNILFNTDKFNENYIDDITNFKCPYCTNMTTFSPKKLNHFNINDKLIKLLIKKKNDKVDLFNNDIVEFNNALMNEVEDLKKIIYNLEVELSNVKINNTIISNKLTKSSLKLNQMNDSNIKYSKIVDLLNNTKKKTVLFNEMNDIINSK